MFIGGKQRYERQEYLSVWVMVVSSNVIVIVVWFALFLQRLYEKCTLDAVFARGVGGHITLCISRAGVGASIFILTMMLMDVVEF